MNTPHEIEVTHSPEDNQSGSSRRSFLKGAALTGASDHRRSRRTHHPQPRQHSSEEDTESMKWEHDHLKQGDRDILVAAQIAEALAVTTYTNIINIAPFFKQIPDPTIRAT